MKEIKADDESDKYRNIIRMLKDTDLQ